MKVTQNGDNFTIYILNNKYDNDIKDYVKKIVLKLKNKSKRYISGYYIVYVYINNTYGMIIELIKEEDFDFFKDFIELDIKIKENSKIYFKFNDYFLIINKTNIYYYNNNYYIDIDTLTKKEFYKLLEYSSIIYNAENIEKDFKKIEFIL